MTRHFQEHKYDPAWYTHLSYTWDNATVLRAELTPKERGLYLDRAEKATLRCAEYLAQEWVNDLVHDGIGDRDLLLAISSDIKDVIGSLTEWFEAMSSLISYEEKHDTRPAD